MNRLLQRFIDRWYRVMAFTYCAAERSMRDGPEIEMHGASVGGGRVGTETQPKKLMKLKKR